MATCSAGSAGLTNAGSISTWRSQSSIPDARKAASTKSRTLWLTGADIALTRSATIYVALAAFAFVLLAVWLVRRARRPVLVYSGIAAAVVAAAAVVLLFGQRMLPLVGKSSDLTGLLGIWEKVIDLAVQRPIAGWGWVSYWTPWAEPFRDLEIRELPGTLPADAAPGVRTVPIRPGFTALSFLPCCSWWRCSCRASRSHGCSWSRPSAGIDGRPRPEGNKSLNASSGNNACR